VPRIPTLAHHSGRAVLFCLGQGTGPDRPGPGRHIRNVDAEALRAGFHKPFPRKRVLMHADKASAGIAMVSGEGPVTLRTAGRGVRQP
jgi:hypothetical protein